MPAGEFERRGQVKMGNRRIRGTLGDLLELHQRFVEAAERPQPAPEIAARLVISGLERHGLFKAGQRFGE